MMTESRTAVLFCIIFTLWGNGVSSEVNQADLECQSRNTNCNICIHEPFCKWCSQPKVNSDKLLNRCVPIGTSGTCSVSYINPKSYHNVTEEAPLTDVGDKKGSTNTDLKSDLIQLTPQKIKLKLRKGVAENITVKFRQAKDFPLDIYFLMDFSNTMETHKSTLARLSTNLINTMRKMTSEVRIGFGSFIDKVLPPFIDGDVQRFDIPDCGKNFDCLPPYSFYNNLKLTKNATIFHEKLGSSSLSTNLDRLEGGLDALMQAMVCGEHIGWKEKGKIRRLLVYSSDSPFHHAGEGRLAGITKPHDSKCYMKDGYYTHYHMFDYPSIGQLSKVAKNEQMNIIFAVPSGVFDLHQNLSKRIEGSSCAKLDGDSENIIEIVKKQYQDITSYVKMTDDADTRISTSYFSKCLNYDGNIEETSICKNLKVGSEVEFTIQVQLDECPALRNDTNFDVIVTNGIDILTLNIEAQCHCDCPKLLQPGDECSNHGVEICGLCECHDGYEGRECQCQSNLLVDYNEDDNDKFCKQSDNATICSGNGKCKCGKCDCYNKNLFSGEYCECDSSRCMKSCNDLISTCLKCSGNGECLCGDCKCKNGFKGRFCDCKTDSACISTESSEKKVCSGNGDCHCGMCKCHRAGDVLYTGKYCEDCKTCKSGKCNKFRHCVQCQQFFSGVYAENNTCDEACGNSYHIYETDSLTEKLDDGGKLCEFTDDSNGCVFRFTYKYNSNSSLEYEIYVLKKQLCPEKLPILYISFGVVSSIVLIGALTLIIWKILVILRHQKEFKDFKKKKNEGSQMQNPLYKPSDTTFSNPMNS